MLTFICPNSRFPSWRCVGECICNRLLVSSLAGPAWWISKIKVWQLETVCSVSLEGGHTAQCSVSKLGGQYTQHCPSWLTVVLQSSTRKKLLIRHICFFELFVQRRRRAMKGETWLGDECPRFHAFQKYRFSMRNRADCTWAEGNCLFPWPAAKGEKVNEKWYETVPSEAMNTVLMRGRGLSILSARAFHHSYQFRLFSVTAIFASLVVLILPFPFLIFLYLLHHYSPLLQQGFVGVQLDSLSSGGSRGQGQDLQIVRQKAETARPSVRTQCAAGIARPCRVTENHDLEPWAGKESTQIHRVWTWAHRPRQSLEACSHWHMVFCSKWIWQSPSWIIVKAQDIAAHHWEINSNRVGL